MHVGDAFPMHMDTEKEGIAAVYQLTHPWEQEWGGVLSFHHPVTKQAELVIPPTFGSLMLFRPQHAPHQVTPVLPAAGEHCRYTMTAFYLAE
jgi:Rps23 Pro-64 3,4-dihydroxylase Tpa1-like proline 4-hydroxylase